MQEIDTSNGVMFPFYDQDTNIVYLCGKVSMCVCACMCVSVCVSLRCLSPSLLVSTLQLSNAIIMPG